MNMDKRDQKENTADNVIGVIIYRIGRDRPVPRRRKAGKWRHREKLRRLIFAWFREN